MSDNDDIISQLREAKQPRITDDVTRRRFLMGAAGLAVAGAAGELVDKYADKSPPCSPEAMKDVEPDSMLAKLRQNECDSFKFREAMKRNADKGILGR